MKAIKTQHEITILGEVPQIVDLPNNVVAHCLHYRQAVKLCIERDRSQRSIDDFGQLLKMAKGSLNTILNYNPGQPLKANGSKKRKRNLDIDLINRIQQQAGNRAITQFLELEGRGQLNHQTSSIRKAELMTELAEIERQEANG